MTNGKRKGSNFERHMGHVLTEALQPLNFRRTQQSGAIVGGKNSANNATYSKEILSMLVGDLAPINEGDVIRDHGWRFRFTLECKFYKTAPNLEHLFVNDTLLRWFNQAANDSVKIGKEPLLIFKFNHTNIFCAVAESTSLPSTVTTNLRFTYPSVTFTVFTLKQALLDLSWWKLISESSEIPVVKHEESRSDQLVM